MTAFETIQPTPARGAALTMAGSHRRAVAASAGAAR